MKFLVRVQVIETHPTKWHHLASYHLLRPVFINLLGSFKKDKSICPRTPEKGYVLFFSLRYAWIPITPCYTVEVFIFTKQWSYKELVRRMDDLCVIHADHPLLLVLPDGEIQLEGPYGYAGPVEIIQVNYEEDNSHLIHQTILRMIKTHYKV